MTKQNELTNQEIADILFIDGNEQNDELDKILAELQNNAIKYGFCDEEDRLYAKQQILDWHKREMVKLADSINVYGGKIYFGHPNEGQDVDTWIAEQRKRMEEK